VQLSAAEVAMDEECQRMPPGQREQETDIKPLISVNGRGRRAGAAEQHALLRR
jgi:hypothetical protein